MYQNHARRIGLIALIILIAAVPARASRDVPDTPAFSNLKKSRIRFILDDTYIAAGITGSGIYYSNQFRDLSAGASYSYGLGQYIPLTGKVMLGTGIYITGKHFVHRENENRISFTSRYLEIPLTASFELPVLRTLDFRLITGIAGSYRLVTEQQGIYSLPGNTAEIPSFQYRADDFHSFDIGWLFGLSMEYRHFLFRGRSSSGFIRTDPQDQGMMYSFNLEVGYFLFRNFNQRKLMP